MTSAWEHLGSRDDNDSGLIMSLIWKMTYFDLLIIHYNTCNLVWIPLQTNAYVYAMKNGIFWSFNHTLKFFSLGLNALEKNRIMCLMMMNFHNTIFTVQQTKFKWLYGTGNTFYLFIKVSSGKQIIYTFSPCP